MAGVCERRWRRAHLAHHETLRNPRALRFGDEQCLAAPADLQNQMPLLRGALHPTVHDIPLLKRQTVGRILDGDLENVQSWVSLSAAAPSNLTLVDSSRSFTNSV